MNRYFDPAKTHHRRNGFQNNDEDFTPKSLAEILRWRWDATRQRLPAPPRDPIPQHAPDLAFIHANAQGTTAMQPAATWIGHATVLAQLGGLNVLTDPIFSNRASPTSIAGPRRHQPPGLQLDQLPRIDVVLVSHNHYDHLDTASAKALNAQAGGPPLFIVPLGLQAWLAKHGIRHAVELDWWDSHAVSTPTAPVEVTLVPARHWSARGLRDQMTTLWGGFAVFSHHCHLFFAGDTAYSRDFADMRARFAERQSPAQGGGFDIALLPIGAYEPRWFMSSQHVNVPEAVQIHRDLGAKKSLGVHWGTFALTDEPLDEPPRALAAERRRQGLQEHEFPTVAIGETLRLPPRNT